MPATPKGPAIFDLVAGAIGIATIGVLGLISHQPMLFPSLGPTLILVLVSPKEPSARPVNALVGHYVGIAAALTSLAMTGLLDAPPVYQEGITGPRVAAAGLSLGLTAGALRFIGRSHPPAGSTTLIVGLGLLTTPSEIATMVVSVAVLVGLCMLIVRIRPAKESPRWHSQRPAEDDRVASSE